MDNSASLLLRILEDGRSKKGSTQASDAWKEILEVDDTPELIGALGNFLALTQRAASDVLRVHDDIDGVNYWRVRIYNGFHSTALGTQWQGFKNQIDDVLLFTLRSHAKILEMHRPQRGLNNDEISKSKDLFDEALFALKDLSLDPLVRVTLLSRIEQIQALLSRYRFMGPDAALDAAKILAAELASAPKDQAEKIKSSGAYSKIKEGLEIMANATQVASSTPLLVASGSFIAGLLT